MKSKRTLDRKTRIENAIREARKLNGLECEQAWLRLIKELEFMSEPEARMPRFNRLLLAVWVAATNENG